MPHFLTFLTDRSKKIRWLAAHYVCHVGILAKHVPLDQAAGAFISEKDPGVRGFLEDLMHAVLDAKEYEKDSK